MALLKVRLFSEKEEPQKAESNEADALRGKYSYEDMVWRKKQLLANPLTGPILPKENGQLQTTEPDEEWIDTVRRARTAVTNGQGALGGEFAHGRESAIADFQLGKLTRWATNTLTAGNSLRRFLEADEKDNFHFSVDRSIERDLPEVVFGYKPMLTTPLQTPTAPDASDKDKKKP